MLLNITQQMLKARSSLESSSSLTPSQKIAVCVDDIALHERGWANLKLHSVSEIVPIRACSFTKMRCLREMVAGWLVATLAYLELDYS